MDKYRHKDLIFVLIDDRIVYVVAIGINYKGSQHKLYGCISHRKNNAPHETYS